MTERTADDTAGTDDDPEARLEAIQKDIDETRRRVDDPTGQGEHHFIQDGEASEGEPVDDTIAPPG